MIYSPIHSDLQVLVTLSCDFVLLEKKNIKDIDKEFNLVYQQRKFPSWHLVVGVFFVNTLK